MKRTSQTTLFLVVLFFASLVSCNNSSIECNEETALSSNDLKHIKGLTEQIKLNPNIVVDSLLSLSADLEYLGYDYGLMKGTYPGQNVKVYYKVLYQDSFMLSYSLRIWHGDIVYNEDLEKALIDVGFTIDEADFYNYEYNIEQSPFLINDCGHNEDVKPNLKKVISPFINTEYGNYGMYGGVALENRMLYEKMKTSLNENDVKLLLCAVNPGTRMLGIEHYINFGSEYKDQEYFLLKIEEIITESPRVKVFRGCIVSSVEAKEIIEELQKGTN